MATWGWGSRYKDVDRHDEYPTRLFDGPDEILDWIVFVDEEKGVYHVYVREDGEKPEPGVTKTYSPFKIVNDECVVEVKHARHKLRVFKVQS